MSHYFQIALEIRNDLDNLDDIGKSLRNVGKICLLQGKIEEAFTNLSKAYEIFDTNKNYTDLSEVALKLGLIYYEAGIGAKPVEKWNTIFKEPNRKYIDIYRF